MTDTTGLLDAILAVQREAPTLKKSATNPHFKASSRRSTRSSRRSARSCTHTRSCG
jgi:hypothetical protein